MTFGSLETLGVSLSPLNASDQLGEVQEIFFCLQTHLWRSRRSDFQANFWAVEKPPILTASNPVRLV
jgi:hypothetical protein